MTNKDSLNNKYVFLFLWMIVSLSAFPQTIELPVTIKSDHGESYKFRKKDDGKWEVVRKYEVTSLTLYNDSARWNLNLGGGKKGNYPMVPNFTGQFDHTSMRLEFMDGAFLTLDPIVFRKNYLITKETISEPKTQVVVAYSNSEKKWIVWIESKTQGFLFKGQKI